jgi:hypothetical protein
MTTAIIRVTVKDTRDAGELAQALAAHLLDTFNGDGSIVGIFTNQDTATADPPPPVWSPNHWDNGAGAWTCVACGGASLRDTEEHPTDHDIDADASTAEVLAFAGSSECAYDCATNARVTCRDCTADMSYPDGVEVVYG